LPQNVPVRLFVAGLAAVLLAPDVGRAAEAGLPVQVTADRIDGIADKETTATGNAEIRRGDVTIGADRLKYVNESEEVTAEGKVRIEHRGDVITGPSLRYRMPDATGVIEKPEYTLAPRGRSNMAPMAVRGSATELELQGDDRYHLTDATFTTCKPGNNDWFAQIGDLDLDFARQVGTARNATIYLLDKPILYLPWLSFSLNNERKTGVLPPTFGTSDKSGPEFTVPYYFNLAPNRDLTLAARYMEKRGMQVNGQFRYIDRNYGGELRFEELPNDKVLRTNRSALTLNHNYSDGRLFGTLSINKVSDNDYFRDLTSRINLTSQTNLNREGVVGFSDRWWGSGTYSATARVQQFQTLQDPGTPVVTPYGRAPQLLLTASRQDVGGLDVNMSGEYVDFSHPTRVVGRRTTVYPSLTMPLLAPGGFLTPKLGLHATEYRFSREPATLSPRANRVLPIFSVDSGLVFERQTNLLGNSVVQTLEPRAYYLRVPYRNQEQIPLFDTAAADFNYAQIFSENSFVGGDRISDANQLTLALTSRLLAAGTGQEAVRATVGQRFYMQGQQVRLNPTDPQRLYRSSDWLAALSGPVAPKWTAETAIQYNGRDERAERFTISARYKPEEFKLLNLSYRFLRDQIAQVDASAQWPLGSNWYGVARYNYSVRDRRVVEALGGFEYNGDCWIGRIVLQRFATATGQTTNAVFLQVELSGFSRIGTNPLETLKRNIPGYSRLNQQTAPSSNQTTDFFE
jgi:LPS-assembly protein